jgi:hypothetical protein
VCNWVCVLIRLRLIGLTRWWRAAIPAALAAALLLAPAAEAGFKHRRIPVPEKKLYDLDAADFNADGNLDVFSTNHTWPSTFLRGSKHWSWKGGIASLGLAPTRAAPGYEKKTTHPKQKGAGLYVYARGFIHKPNHKNRVSLKAKGVRASGRIILDPKRKYQKPFSKRGSLKKVSSRGDRAYFKFDLKRGGFAYLPVAMLDLPVIVKVNEIKPDAPMRVGANAVRVNKRRIELTTRDRHAVVVADSNGDGALELLSVVGGLGGNVRREPFRSAYNDRLYTATSPRRFKLSSTQLAKSGCRGRHSAALDANGDGRTDYFTACEEDVARVHIQQPDGSFALEKIGRSRGDVYRWMQFDRDPGPELVAIGASIRVFERRNSGRWARIAQQRLYSRGAAQRALAASLPPSPMGDAAEFEEFIAQSASIGDFDGDGDADVLVASKEAGNVLALNRGGRRFRKVRAARFGMPSHSAAATLVDYDNDGDLDVHAIPQGLYKRGKHRFRRTGKLRSRPKRDALSGVSNWADFNNDGLRDALWAHGQSTFGRRHEVELRQNTGRSRRWLEVDAPGAQLAARVKVVTGKGARKRASVGWVGAADDSRNSHAHHRVYFGLGGKRRRARRATVIAEWVDGSRSKKRVRLNRVVRLSP